ncbi:helix-turn-helix transcriptional regulator [Robiginitalea sp. SC105]|uniref:helix-turn-helix transcriptional regulator n=1 Tax=Robiginitalea sp. SC105 TaxID=2762332 RepID=UPI00163AEB49|nr:AraC family transcriptional regulator [Robiginitalea sp. SC105]MBC2839270.1 helix-turn-helix transcriptional regulator [Robiginitalea sp. SC105]
MLGLRESSPIDMLRQFAVYLNAKLQEGPVSGNLLLDNNRGSGTIKLFELLSGLTAWVYDITFTSDLTLDLNFSEDKPYYFGYHLSGHQLHKFGHEADYQEIRQWQNFLLMGKPGTQAEFIIPANVPFKSCYLIVNPKLLKKADFKAKNHLEAYLQELISRSGQEGPFRLLGSIDTKIGQYVETIVNNRRTDLVGRLLTEGAVIGMLASQLEAHREDQAMGTALPTDLSASELERVRDLADNIRDHIERKITLEDMAREIGLPVKKLQKGIRYLYGHSAHEFISNIRLELARELIETTDMNISEICYSIGYSSRSHFSKMFRSRYGVLPSSYKSSS